MIDILKAVALGLVQGATEFLPVSSSGHLIAAQTILGFEAPLAFDVALHLATLVAMLFYFGRYLLQVFRTPRWRALTLRLVLGNIPAVLIALAFYAWRGDISPWFVVVGWSVSSAYLLLSAGREGRRQFLVLPLPTVMVIGATQGIAAALPGFSRSGASITSGLWLGLSREEAFRGSFLLAIPVTAGAVLFEGRHLLDGSETAVPGGALALAVAMGTAFVVGLMAIHILRRAVVSRYFHRFGWYNLLAAVGFAAYLVFS